MRKLARAAGGRQRRIRAVRMGPAPAGRRGLEVHQRDFPACRRVSCSAGVPYDPSDSGSSNGTLYGGPTCVIPPRSTACSVSWAVAVSPSLCDEPSPRSKRGALVADLATQPVTNPRRQSDPRSRVLLWPAQQLGVGDVLRCVPPRPTAVRRTDTWIKLRPVNLSSKSSSEASTRAASPSGCIRATYVLYGISPQSPIAGALRHGTLTRTGNGRPRRIRRTHELAHRVVPPHQGES